MGRIAREKGREGEGRGRGGGRAGNRERERERENERKKKGGKIRQLSSLVELFIALIPAD